MPPTPEALPEGAIPETPMPELQSEAVIRRGLPWPAWVIGLIAMLAGILYVFVIYAR